MGVSHEVGLWQNLVGGRVQIIERGEDAGLASYLQCRSNEPRDIALLKEIPIILRALVSMNQVVKGVK